MATIITKELAERIAAKLQAVSHPKKNRPHDLYRVYHEGVFIAHFGIRRSSKKDQGHDHVPATGWFLFGARPKTVNVKAS